MLRLGRAASRTVTVLLAALLGLLILALAGAGTLAWRLSDGPLDVTWLADRLVPVLVHGVSARRVTVALDRLPDGHELRVRVEDGERAADADEPAQSVRSATVGVALQPLWKGNLVPTDIVLDGLRLHLTRGSGSDHGEDPRRLLSRLRRLVLTDAQADLADGPLGQRWMLRDGEAEITRAPDGILRGHAAASVSAGGATVRGQAQGTDGPDGARVELTVPSVNPAALARAIPALAAAAALDADVALRGTASLGPDFSLQHASMHAETGPGTAQLPMKGGGTAPAKFASATLDADGTPESVTLGALRLVLAPASGNAPSTAVLSGTAQRTGGRFTAKVTAGLDRVALSDLGNLWPERVGGNARTWLTENLTAGTVHDAHATFTLTGAENGNDIDLVDGSGTLIGDDVTIWWLRPVPPVQHAHAVLAWQSRDVTLISVTGGRDSGIDVKSGTVRITGLVGKDQTAFIQADLAGGLGDVLTLLKHPRLRLLSKHPLPFTAATGALGAHLSIQLPLESKVAIEQVAIHANAQVVDAHLGGIAAGRDLDRGRLALDVTNDGMTIDGPAEFGHIPIQLAVQMDFKEGPKTQVLEHVKVGARLTKADAERAGFGLFGLEKGVLAATVDYAERRDGISKVMLDADLKDAQFITPLGWSKAAGSPGHAEARATLDHGRLVGLDGVQATAPGLDVAAHSDMVAGRPSVVHLERGEIGRTNATGTIVLPQREGEPYRVTLAGSRLDLEGRLTTAQSPAASDVIDTSKRAGPPYAVDLRFERVVFGRNHGLGPVSLTATDDGRRVTAAHLATGGAEHARLDLVTAGTARRLTAVTADLGGLLRDTDLTEEVDGGQLTLEGSFDDRQPGSPFNGNVDLKTFKVQGAPAAAKLLQALTVYGLVDALRGPGLVVDRFATAFRLQGSMIDVEDARAYSSSLGVTAMGRFDFGRKTVDMKGTIVPAYFFNSLPGRIPLIGKLFSPEQGSGLFAANFTVRGAVADPSVSINPLSALTPGITRKFFDLFR